jgi:hypothetical protein
VRLLLDVQIALLGVTANQELPTAARAEHLLLLTADDALLALASKDPRLPVRGARDRG